RRSLGERAAQSPPGHVIDLLGEPPTDDHLEHWVNAAGRIEGYREEWRLRPAQLLDHPDDHTQATSWAATVKPLLDSRRLEQRFLQHQAPSTDRDVPGIEM
ncbi:MAG: hypothetical protein JWR83_1952, partial [Aeromicrobium sp.]|nr:hypothetical protein [Aeromicrobium sp.]